MRKHRTLSVWISTLALWVAAAPAYAGSVNGTAAPMIFFASAPGEENHLTVTQVGDSVTLLDEGAPLTAMGTCVSTDASTAVCPTNETPLSVVLGDLDDSATIEYEGFTSGNVFGGGGADTITIKAWGLNVMGGYGNDDLTNQVVADLNGEGGNDTLRSLGGDSAQ